MATLAALLKRRGFDVRGSDQNVYPPMSDFLAAEGIPIATGYSVDHIGAEVDLVVVGNAISRGNPELESVLERKIRYCSLPELPLGRPVNRGGRYPRQDDHNIADRMAPHPWGPRPDRAGRRHRAELRRGWIELPGRQRPGFRHRG
jgi:hypothetical protein